ncbi:heme/copper-type cytochrome/quinol oxidase subunit 2 [Bacillus sp. SLBN-57]
MYMLSFIVLFGLSFIIVCFIFFTILYFAVNLQKREPKPFQKAAEQTVDTIILIPISWLFTALYICILFILFPIRHFLDFFQQKR